MKTVIGFYTVKKYVFGHSFGELKSGLARTQALVGYVIGGEYHCRHEARTYYEGKHHGFEYLERFLFDRCLQ